MVLLLNEKSLDGQFADIEAFYDTLPVMSRNLRILKKTGVSLLKHSSLYERQVTKDKTLLDIKNCQENVAPRYRDQLRQWKRELSQLMLNPPYWDLDKTTCVGGPEEKAHDSLVEAALRSTDVLSFAHEAYRDRILQVCCEGHVVLVDSIVSTEYLLDVLLQKAGLDLLTYIKRRFKNGRIRLDHLDSKTDSTGKMQRSEWEEAIDAMKRFDNAGSWEEIKHDRFFDYKSYKPKSRREDYFANTVFAGRQIDKFRCGQHSQVRCFGYREQDKFYVLAMERDHSISDTG